MDTRLEDAVKRIIADELQRSPDDVRHGLSLRKDLGMDSVAAINIVFAIEEVLGIHVPETELESVDDMDQVIRLVRRLQSA